jgi:hypothetical protein
MILSRIRRGILVRIVQANCRSRSTPQKVSGRIDRDAPEPRAELLRFAELAQTKIRLNERFLRRVLHIVEVAEVVVCDAAHGVPIPVNKLRKRGGLASQRPLDQLPFASSQCHLSFSTLHYNDAPGAQM